MSHFRFTNIYFDLDTAFAASESVTVDGVGIENGHAEELSAMNPGEVGAAIRRCLALSSNNIPPPPDFRAFVPAARRLSGERSWTKFNRRFDLMILAESANEYIAEETENFGSRRGYGPGARRSLSKPADDVELGNFILRLMGRKDQ